MKRLAFLVTLAMGIHSAHAASDFNLLGLYVGGAVGRSDVRNNVIPLAPLTSTYDFDQRATGWKAFLGVRPIPLIAAELAYVDFGHPSVSTNPAGPITLHSDELQHAETLSGLIFAPIPLPLIGLYGRAGIARLHSSGNPYFQCVGASGVVCSGPYGDLRFNRTNTDFYYGAGLQVKFSALAARLEYERINDSRGSPDMLSVGLTWTF